MTNKKLKEVESLKELEDNWKSCVILGLRKHMTKQKLIEGFKLGIRVLRNQEK